MDFIYQGPITTELKKNCSNRVKEIWNELQGTSPDQDFVDYVEVVLHPQMNNEFANFISSFFLSY